MKRTIKYLAAAAFVGALGLGYGSVAHAGYVGWSINLYQPAQNLSVTGPGGTIKGNASVGLFSSTVNVTSVTAAGPNSYPNLLNAVQVQCTNNGGNYNYVILTPASPSNPGAGDLTVGCPLGDSLTNGNGTFESY
jgi:hypothetical protein